MKVFSAVYVRQKQLDQVTQKRSILTNQRVSDVPLAQWIARWTSNPKVLGSTPRWDDGFFCFWGRSLMQHSQSAGQVCVVSLV